MGNRFVPWNLQTATPGPEAGLGDPGLGGRGRGRGRGARVGARRIPPAAATPGAPAAPRPRRARLGAAAPLPPSDARATPQTSLSGGGGPPRTRPARRLSRPHKGGPARPAPLPRELPRAGVPGCAARPRAPSASARPLSSPAGTPGAPPSPPGALTRLQDLRRDRAGDARPQDDVQRPQAPEQPPTHGSPRRSS